MQKVECCCKQAVICILASVHCLGSGGPLPHLFSSLAHCCTCEGRLKAAKPGLKICCQLQQPCADKLKFALERHAGRTCHDEHYEILLLPYCCGVRTVCSEQIRSLINSVLFSRWQTRKGRAVVLHRFTLNKWFVCVVTVDMTPSHWGSQRSNQVLRFLVTAQLVSHLS